ncbi:MAG: thiamine diphosphokinase [Anaerolineae bacterium]|nr:thiamine diphosphokinase [Anaerolineae bacterium]MDW8069304.1 thiamine diphosphokinase [Anaerolineae bacterium]
MTRRVLIFANGALPNLEWARRLLQPEDTLIGADGGTHHLLAVGRFPHEVVGDLDSLSPALLDELQRQGTRISRYPREKDETDLELALRHALAYQPEVIRVLGALGQRLDQTLANLALLAAPWLEGVDVRLDDGVEEVLMVQSEAVLSGRAGETVSLIPWRMPVEGISTEGLRWPLREETLYPERTRGISNEMTGAIARIRIRAGHLLVIHRKEVS